MDPEKIMDGISTEILATLKEMQKIKVLEERLMYSKIVSNLCNSLGVFLSLISDMALHGDGEDEPTLF